MKEAKPARKKREIMGSEETPENRAPRLLLAEDDVEMRKMLSWSLGRAGYEVVECRNGNSLMKHIMLMDTGSDEERINLIISDIRMPGFTGMQVLESANELGDFPPVVLITAFPGEEVMEEAKRLGAREIFEKPFNVDDLIAEVRRIVPVQAISVEADSRAPEEEVTRLMFPLDAVYRHDSASEPIKSFVKDMAAKLNSFGEHITNCRLVIDESDSDQYKKHRYRITIHVTVPGHVVVVEHDSDEGVGHENLYCAIRIAFGTVSRKLKHLLRKRAENKKQVHNPRGKAWPAPQNDIGESS